MADVDHHLNVIKSKDSLNLRLCTVKKFLLSSGRTVYDGRVHDEEVWTNEFSYHLCVCVRVCVKFYFGGDLLLQ